MHPNIVGSPLADADLQAQAPAQGPATPYAPQRLTWATEADTERFARALAACPDVRDSFIALHGDLGAGKTTLVRHLLRGLGVQGRIKSPTYAVVEPYEPPGLPAWHFDFYRFDDPREWEDAGFRDLFAQPGLKLVEWPQKAAGILPVADLDLHLYLHDDERREVLLQAHSPRGVALMHSVLPAMLPDQKPALDPALSQRSEGQTQ